MKKQWIAFLLAMALIAMLFAGCGSQAPTGETPSSSAASAGAEAETPAEQEEAEPETAEMPAEETASAEEELIEEPAEEAPDYREPLTYPIADGDVTFTILHNEPALGPMTGQMNMSTYGDFETIALGTQTIGVTPIWSSMSAMAGETQFNLIVASGDYPDVFTAIDKYYPGSFAKALEDEVIVTIDPDVLGDNMPAYWNLLEDDPVLKKAVTTDEGEFAAWYSVFDHPVVNEGYFIRKDMCDKLGMEVPTSIDELNDYLYGAKSEFDLSCVMMLASDLAAMIQAYGVAGTAATGSGFAYHREGEQIVADITSERYHEYVEQLAQWYADGIVSQNFTELDSGNFSGDMEAELAAGRTTIVRSMVNSMDNLVNLGSDPDFKLAAMVVTKDGGNIHTGQGERQFDCCSMSGTCDPDLYPYVLGWMNYWYTDEGAMLGSYGIQGLDYDYDENGDIYYLDNIMKNELGYPPMLFSRARCFSGASFGLMYNDRTVPFYTDEQLEVIDTWTSRTDDEEAVPLSMSINTEESQVVAEYAPDLATYISEVIPKFVTGEKPLDEWDAFMDEVSGMHVDELAEVYQAAYDRYMG